MDLCLKSSSPFLGNYDSCYESFRENVSSCPCVEDQTQKEPGDVSILSILHDVSQSYVMSGDGSSKISAEIEEQKRGQVMFAKHAIIKEKLYLFGTGTKIAILFECSVIEIAEKLIYNRDERAEALSITEGSQALICFSENSNECEIFDGRTSRRTLNSTFTHDLGGLGYYKGQPTSVGCQSTNNKKTETLTASGWTTLPDFPENYASHNLIGLKNGGMILVGGYNAVGYFSRIWQLKDNRWTKLGDLQTAHGLGSAIFTGNSIYVFPGGPKTENEHAIQRIDFTAGEDFLQTQIIGYHSGWYKYPILLETSAYYCRY
ncbi:Oidioi.mRNA.OKI2018_I69.chr1.g2865.t1.cds [Oikopleura dioica]|uniref:Oidioi.mRNA.OKI2018_I69.chr1.g2865.t1.cds n=1 Tax=Oikopleura dioica TaxID=34765 RepID=A0ABN7SSF2_OIKDI|nr:Oidioi.mRNA.OKI2018_I69.chr1.g2865.t1.cds [Oikopleura dioica]